MISPIILRPWLVVGLGFHLLHTPSSSALPTELNWRPCRTHILHSLEVKKSVGVTYMCSWEELSNLVSNELPQCRTSQQATDRSS